MWQRIVRQLVERGAEAGLLLEVDQRIVRADKGDGLDIGTLRDQLSQPLGLAFCQFLFEEDGEVERVVPAAADLLGILHDDVDGGGQRERDGDYENDHEAGERMPHQPAQRTERGTRMTR